MIVLGLNAYHGDASACLLRDGRLVAAVEEERFRRIKHWSGFPSEAIRYCLAQAGVRLQDVDCVAVNGDPGANLGGKLRFTLRSLPSPALLLDRLQNSGRRMSIEAALEKAVPEGTFHGIVQPVEHHLAHLASAFFTAPYEHAVAVSVDSFGDMSSAAWGLGAGTRLQMDGRVGFPHSLGIFYQALTQFLGFPHYGDEHKVMGLAPYGQPSYLDEMRRVVKVQADGTFRLQLDYFRHHREKLTRAQDGGTPESGPLWSPKLEQLLGPPRTPRAPVTPRHADIASSVQAMYEEALGALLGHIHAIYGVDNLVLAGGCALNSAANGRICTSTPFRHLHVPAAAGNAGGALGAALAVWHDSEVEAPRQPVEHACWGPGYTDAEIGVVIKNLWSRLRARDCAVRSAGNDAEVCEFTARALADGKVVGWFQGRMEWGPRPLGNRSILADPRRADMREFISQKIKRRDSFRPFSPSILREAVADWFEVDADVPYMSQAHPIREERQDQVPAVTHVDGSSHLHTVSASFNPLYHRLISAFRDITGVPMLLNTSFTDHELLVCNPAEALECFLRSDMEVLVMGRYLLDRSRTTG
ncbi:MAG: carbamoyltransferase [Nitrospirota bacterium]|nr:carbamoyltransferase [Nitrospirota bacterium]